MKSSSQLRVVFRTDASIQIGTGHVMRCLTLADALSENGAQCTFICRPHNGHLLDAISKRGHHVVPLSNLGSLVKPTAAQLSHAAWLGTDWQTDAQDTRQALGKQQVDWLVVDHYALDRQWEQMLRPNCQNLMVIDDLADRPHDCDLLLDQNLGRTAQDYDGLLDLNTRILIGPQFALLRPEFVRLRNQSLAKRVKPRLRQLLVTMGGVDKDNTTGQVLRALKAFSLPPELNIIVVMGPHAPYLDAVKQQAAQMPWTTQVLVSSNDMAHLMLESDLAIGAAGSTSWERCCMGLPTIMVILADNQRCIAKALHEAGAVVLLDVDQNNYQLGLSENHFESEKLDVIGKVSASIADGLGTIRVVTALLKKG